MSEAAKKPGMLADVKVLDFTQYLAGPTITRLMAEMGAQVIKVEQAPMGDPSRLLPAIKNGRSGYFVQQNRGKRSLCLDFAKPESMELLRALVREVDVVLENYGPGVMDRRGLDYASLKKINPRIIMASISAFGKTGPYAHKVGYDFIAQAFSGLMSMTGDPNGPPMFVGLGIADQGSGVHAFAAIGYALFYRQKTGIGQHIDISMVDALFHMHEVNVQAYGLTDGAFVPHRMGSHHQLICPCGAFKGPQGYIVVLVLDRQWAAMATAMGRPDLINDPRYATGAERGKNQKELIPIIEAWMAAQGTDEAVLKIFEAHRVPAAPVMSVVGALDHPYFKARNMVRTVTDPLLGELTITGFPLKFSEFPDLPTIEAPLLGEHGGEMLKQYLGMSDAKVAALRASGVLISERK
ncbi:MAG: CaiB/BaiF CoA transferase family protein [Candidatus Binataceae bacterium]